MITRLVIIAVILGIPVPERVLYRHIWKALSRP